MNILFAAIAPPYPPTHGQRLRNWALLKALRQQHHNIHLVSFCADQQEAEQAAAGLSELCATTAFVRTPGRAVGWGKYLSMACALGSKLPQGVWRFRSVEFRLAVEAALQRWRPDVLLCDDIYAISNIPDTGCPIVLNKHDFQHVILGRYVQHVFAPARRTYAWVEAHKLRRWESLACRRADAVLAASMADADIVRRLAPKARVSVVPNAIDVESYSPEPDDDGVTLLYAGSLDWYPNRDAAEWFVRSTLPLVRAQVPGARFLITGSCRSEAVRRSLEGTAGVQVTGFVPDLHPFLAKTSVCVVPLRIGSGTRLKILEAAAMAKAIVSTAVGAEGLNFQNGHDLILADEPDRFADAVIALLSDAGRRRALGQAARETVQRHYSVAALEESLNSAFAQVC